MPRRSHGRAKGAHKFERCVAAVSRRGGVRSPEAVCAASLRRTGWRPQKGNPADAASVTSASGTRKFDSLDEAQQFAYWLVDQGKEAVIRWHGKIIFSSTGHRNPAEAAESLAEAFHGRPPESETEITYADRYHEHVAGLGELDEITFATGPVRKLASFQGAMLTSNEAGTQLYVDGGDQQVSSADWPDLDWSKERLILGRVKGIVYTTAKFHLGKSDREPGPYKHRLGEESGQMPELEYDVANRRLAFVGGSYSIKIDMPGGFSAGLRD